VNAPVLSAVATMPRSTARKLRVAIGQHSDKGRKEVNQDFHGAVIPNEPQLSLKGVAVVVADGISSSTVSGVAAESAVKSFLTDYYCTSDAWSVKTSAQRVIAATNSWLHAQTRRSPYLYEKDKGYVCTFSALVIKGKAAHIFHVGDTRIYRVVGNALEQLTNDHQVTISSEQKYLSRALGINQQSEIDYRTLRVEPGDVFLLATDGVYEHVEPRFVTATIRAHAGDLDRAAREIVQQATLHGSPDNLTLQIVRLDELPEGDAVELFGQAPELPLPPLLEPRMDFDGYRIVRELHASSRSHIYLAVDAADEALVAIKVPSIELRGDPQYLKRFMMEEWVARRVSSAHVLKPRPQSRRQSYLYVVMEFVEGQTLRQWMIDNPRPDLETVRGIVEQIASGLQAFHRMEMLHQDIRPDNVMIDKTGTVKIIDFGSTRVKGVVEASPSTDRDDILGTVQYTAPEYFLGESGTTRSDLFSLGVIAYQMLTGRLPYGAEVAKARTRSQQKKLRYESVLDDTREIPAWVDEVLRKAVQSDPYKRFDELSEFVFNLRRPGRGFLTPTFTPLLERNPLLFWKASTLVLAIAVVLLLVARYAR
jgi:serine/threonine protein phosphatase PrpC